MAKRTLSAEAEEFIDREVFGGTSNDEVLERPSGQTSDPANDLSHVYQLPRERMKHTWPWLYGYRLRALTFAFVVRKQHTLHRGLPPAASQPDVFDVFVVSRPSLSVRALAVSLIHWSVYCNGHYYHLTALPQSADGRSRTTLRDEDFSYPSSPLSRAQKEKQGGPLMAYHIGQTSYSPEEIKRIAEWVIRRLSHYDIFAGNCQHFALCLVVRIVNRGRLLCVFLGTAGQIAHWAFQRKNGNSPLYSGFSVGFELTRANDQVRNFSQRAELSRRLDLYGYQLENLWPQGAQGLIADDALRYSSWRRQMCFPLMTDLFPSWRTRFLRPNPSTSHSVKMCTALWADHEPYKRGARQIADDPVGFDEEDVYWSMYENRQNQQGVDDFLVSCGQNQEKYYHIGIAYLDPRGHAAVILQDCDCHSDARPLGKFKTIYKYYTNGDLPESGIRLLHICFSPGVRDTLSLVLVPSTKKLKFSRYHNLYCVGTTERTLRHIALQSCPEEHQYMKNDCATFVFNFVTGMLGYLEKQHIITGVGSYVDYLVRHNHVQDGLLGATETGSRQNGLLGESGHLLVESYFDR